MNETGKQAEPVADNLIRRYVASLLDNKPEEAGEVTKLMVDYVFETHPDPAFAQEPECKCRNESQECTEASNCRVLNLINQEAPAVAQPPDEVVRELVEALREIQVSAEDCAEGKYPWPHHQNYKDFAGHAKAALKSAKEHGL